MKRIIRLITLLTALAGGLAMGDEAASAPAPAPAPALTVSDLALEGAIEGENITFELRFTVADLPRRSEIPLVIGDVAFLDGTFPSGAKLVRRDAAYVLQLGWRRSGAVAFRFASRPVKQGEWRQTRFSVPSAAIRKLSVLCDRDDLDVRFPGALDIQTVKAADGRTRVTGSLGISDAFEIGWKPQVRRLDSELVVACDANTIATASVGTLRLDTVFSYRVIQGALTVLALDLPAVNVIQVRGDDIKEWRIDRTEEGQPRLHVALSRPKEGVYRLHVESEMFLPQFPCTFVLPVLAPRDVLRTSGFLMIGTDSAIKLTVNRAAGMTQVDQAAFPEAGLDGDKAAVRAKPGRSRFAYQYANSPYKLELKADDIVSSFTADNRLTLSLAENELTFAASVEIDVRDAPAREIAIETDPDPAWTVTSIAGQLVSEADTDVRDEAGDGQGAGRRVIYVPFQEAVTGTALVTIQMERSLAPDAATFVAPRFRVLDAKSERGYLVASAEKGVQLKPLDIKGMREVHTGSAPMKVPGAQQAFRFKQPDWALTMGIERTPASLHSEVFHLVSLGEGVLYASASITYHISGAPVQMFRIKVPSDLQNVEFTGADIEGWTREGDIHTVRLQTRIMGDFTLLVTYDYQFPYAGADIPLGVVETVGTESEVGYIALASSLSLKREHREIAPSIIVIDKDEIPSAYTAPVTDPILESFKYVRVPHTAVLSVKPYETEQLLGQIADYTRLSTRFTKDGEAVTTATYYVKNSSRQYLVLRLPQGVKLWSVHLVDDAGIRSDVLSQTSDEGLLIPVLRPRDPNTALRIDVTFAQSHAGMNALKGALFGVHCNAPVLPDSQATYASWEIVAPDGFAVAGSGGNMAPASGAGYVGFGRVARLALSLGAALLDGPGGWRLRQVLSADFAPQRRAEFVRTVNLSGGEALALTVFLAPDWLGGSRSPRMVGAVCGAGLILLMAGLAARRLRWVPALGMTVLAFGMAQFGLGRAVLAATAILLAAAALLWLLRALLPRLWRLLRRVGRGLAALWRWVRNARARSYQRQLELRLAATGAAAEDVHAEERSRPDRGATTPPVLLGLIAATGTLLLGASLCSAGAAPVMDLVAITITGPGNERDAEPSAEVSMTLSFEAKERTSFVLVPATSVLLSHELSSHNLELVPEGTGYVLRVTERGEYQAVVTYRTPVSEVGGSWRLPLAVPPSIRNTVSVRLPQIGIDVQCAEAVLLRCQDNAQGTVAEAVLGPARQAMFTWQPRVRTTALEDAVFFCEVNSLAVLQSGAIDLTTVVRHQIAQGEIKDLKLRVPEGMSVTSVRAPGLATWSFDPTDRILDAVLEKPVAGDFSLTLVMQIASEGLPYEATLRTPDVLDAVRQRGSIAVAADDDVQVRITDSSGVNPMNVEDFPAALTAAQEVERQKRGRSLTVRRSFRYGQAGGVAIAVEAEKVLPEIRVNETGTLSIADERIVLATKLVLAVAKSGIFSVALDIPSDYDVETLTGRDVSHWDETGVQDGGKGVVVHFTRQIVDATDINLVVARSEKGIEESIVVPRVGIADVSKHSGRLTVSGERGVRLMVDTHRGVDVRKASEEGIRQAGVLVFDILRPAWSIVLKTDVLAPVVKPEVLQWVDLAEGMLQCRVYLQYRIENAGVKTFRIQSPAPGASLAFTGRQIARVAEIDKAAGIWQVDLHGKVEDRFSMTATYQVPYDPASHEVKILPLQALDADEQRGYLVVTCAGRVKVQAAGNLSGLKVEDPRTVPSTFGAGDLSGAILCYRTLRSDYELSLSVVRHDSASVLPASIDRAQFTSALSTSGDLLTRAELDLRVGNLRLLRVTLPSPTDTLWTVLVDGREVATSRDGAAYCIPLEETQGNETSQVDLVYAGRAAISGLPERWHFTAPKFGLPLTGITWRFYAPAGWRYYQFGGSMEHGEEDGGILQVFDAGRYMAYNMEQRTESIQNAREVLDAGEELIKAGQQKRARKAFQVALNYSQGQEDLNEDARVQLRNVMKQQVKMGLVNRRDALRFSRNIIDEQQTGQMEGFQDGDFTQEYAEGVAQRLSERDNDALELVANRIIDQQAAAAGVVTAIRVTMPTQGRALPFRRALQIDPNVDLTVSFAVSRGYLSGVLEVLWPTVALFLALWLIPLRRRLRGARA